MIVAVLGTFVHIKDRQQRRQVYLASLPGSMAHYMSVLSHIQSASMIPVQDDRDDVTITGDAELVGPLDTEKVMEEKLRGIRFMLDRSSGCVVAVVPDGGRVNSQYRRSLRRGGGSDEQGGDYELDDIRKSLLGKTSSGASKGYNDPFDAKDSDRDAL